MRHKARLYGHVKGRTIEKLVEEAMRLKEDGFTALGHLNPLLDEEETTALLQAARRTRSKTAIDNVRRLREAVGPERRSVHRDPPPPDPARGDRARPRDREIHADVLRGPAAPQQLRRHGTGSPTTSTSRSPPASASHSLYQFQTLLTRNGVQYLRPDVCLCGGITGAKKIAAMAEAHDAWVVPHNPLSPVSTAACLQIAACIPNFAIQEYPSRTPDLDGSADLLGNDLATGLAEQEGGFIAIPGRARDRRRAGGGRGAALPATPPADPHAPARWTGRWWISSAPWPHRANRRPVLAFAMNSPKWRSACFFIAKKPSSRSR